MILIIIYFLKASKIEPSILTEETAEELAEVISPEQKPKTPDFKIGGQQSTTNSEAASITSNSSSQARVTIDQAGTSILSQGGVTVLSIGDLPKDPETNANEEENEEGSSAKL